MQHQRKVIYVPPKLYAEVKAMCDEREMTMSELIRKLLREELTNWQREQQQLGKTKPTETGPLRPVGRPRDSAEIKKAKEIAERVEKNYIILKTMYNDDDFQMLYGEQYDRLQKAIASLDLAELVYFDKERPWQIRR